MIVTRGISFTNFFVASSALAFQVFVLYPWHKKLDDEFHQLKHEHVRVLDTIEKFHGVKERLSLQKKM
ncbi:hypothetical protein TWF730_010301 [Orbilia blumenaviensis]|uniref:Uncharacterized protein n=1 Tax=Orbilia blumenaviensis TaxID=1796055 RepID=A0AAV9USE7_9PEZI